MAPNPSAISDTELFWSLVDKADRKFTRLRDSPSFGRNRNESDFQKAFKMYTRLWKMQQEHRQKLLDAGLRRWEVGEIASRIGQLYYGQYLRTSDSGYLRECYIFYEALLEREYFKDGGTTGQTQLPPQQQEPGLTKKQLRFLGRFIVVCLLMGRREMVARLAGQLRVLVEECKKYFKEMEHKEWKVVVHEIHRFLKVDALITSTRPLRYSFVFDSHPDALPYVSSGEAKKGLKLSDAILCSYHHNEIKFKELSLDTFRILQSLEWEPSGSFSLPIEQDVSEKATTHNPLKDIRDPTLPPNPRKALLYRHSASHFLLVLATLAEELPPNGILLLYLSAAGGNVTHHRSSGSLPKCSENSAEPASSMSDVTSESSSSTSSSLSSSGSKGNREGFVCLGSQGDGGQYRLYPCDLIPFTRKPLFLIIDSTASYIFKNIHGAEKGETTSMLLSPRSHFPTSIGDSFQTQYGSSFTMFLTSPLQAFGLLFGIPTFNKDKDAYNKAEKILSSMLIEWGLILAKSDSLHPIWVEVLGDPFLRRFLLRFVFCRSAIALSTEVSGRAEYIPECLPPLPESAQPHSPASQSAILQLAKFFDVTHHFAFSFGTLLPGSDVLKPSNCLDSDVYEHSASSQNGDQSV